MTQKLSLVAAAGLTLGLVAATALSQSSGPAVPMVEGYGKVTHFPDAAEQPRPGSKILVDMTDAGPRDALSPSIEKVARFVNIYAAAGKVPTTVDIAVVLHGDATQLALDDETYGKAFGVAGNPNVELMRTLREHGVEFLVCGQSLTRKGFRPDQIHDHVTFAVSGLTAIVNRQADGYSYLPLLK